MDLNIVFRDLEHTQALKVAVDFESVDREPLWKLERDVHERVPYPVRVLV